MIKIGSKIRITSDNENYKKYMNKTLIITKIYNDTTDCPLYDMSVYPQKLVESRTKGYTKVPFLLYEYEFEEA